MSIAPNQRLSVTLEAKDWNTVLAILAEGPYRVVGPILGEIQRQCMAEAGPPRPAEVLPLRKPEESNG
jgi:hypothetical protein